MKILPATSEILPTVIVVLAVMFLVNRIAPVKAIIG